MNRLWLREYEILLSSNRRDERIKKPVVTSKYSNRPQTANIAISSSAGARRIKKQKEILSKERRNENDLATEILAISTKGEYRRSAPELNERKFGTKKYSPSPRTTSPFRGIQTLEQYEEMERKKENFYQTNDPELFNELFPPVNNTSFQPVGRPKTSYGQRSRSKNGMATPGSRGSYEGEHDPNRRKSSPSRINHATSIVQTLLKSTNNHDHITANDLEIAVAPIDKDVAQQAEGIWEQLITEIWTSGQSILYNELTIFATSWQKSPTSRSIVRYLCALFGLKTHTSHLLVLAAERSLFRELLPLLKYLREINPLTVPRKRLLKARAIYDKHFIPLQEEHSLQITDSESYLHMTPLEQKFLR